MKAINLNIILIIIVIVSCGSSCGGDQYQIMTKILNDGSCERSLTIVSDDDSLDTYDFPISVDSSWYFIIDSAEDKSEVKVKNGDTTYEMSYTHNYTKHFNDIETLNKDYKRDDNYFSVADRNVSLTKKFRWFYTFYIYEETYKKLLQNYPMAEFLSKDEYNALMNDEPDTLDIFIGLDSNEIDDRLDEIEERYEEWHSRSLFEEYYQYLYSKLKNDDSLAHLVNEIHIYKDTVYNWLISNNQQMDDLINKYDTLLEAEGKILSWTKEKDSNLIDIEKKIEFMEENWWGTSIINKIIMPGRIINTNSDILSSDTVTYGIITEMFFTEDYEMEVKSKIINKWSFYISGIIILLAVIGFLRSSRNG